MSERYNKVPEQCPECDSSEGLELVEFDMPLLFSAERVNVYKCPDCGAEIEVYR